MCAQTSKWCMDALFRKVKKFVISSLFLSRFGLHKFLDINEEVSEEAVKLFYANFVVPKVLNPFSGPILWKISSVLPLYPM